MSRSLLVLAFLLWGIGASAADAQRQLERGLILNPFFGDDPSEHTSGISWMHQWGGWAGLSHYGLIRDEAHLWLHQLGGYFEIARFGDTSSLLLTSQIEFIADPRNEIRFNPRSVFWEEGLLFTHRREQVDLQIGYYHRCKHDVDNLVDSEQRTLIYGSLTGRAVTSGDTWQAALKTDLYTIRQDFRRPPETRDALPDWDRLLASSELVVRTEQPLGSEQWLAFVGGHIGFSAFSDTDDFWQGLIQPTDVAPSGGLSTGLALRGDGAELRLTVDYEYMHDTGIPPIPQSAHLLRFGILALNPSGLR